jgi:Zn ribbon nucleic-acid-binding protein
MASKKNKATDEHSQAPAKQKPPDSQSSEAPANNDSPGGPAGDRAERDRRDSARERFSFRTVSKCPRCGTTDTQAVSTQGNVQYRTCRRIGCLHHYTVIGQRVEP